MKLCRNILLFFNEVFYCVIGYDNLQEYGLYFGKSSFYDLIKSIGGQWNDTKERPIVCMMKALDYSGIYWAVPIGNWEHRSEEAKTRIERFMSLPDNDLRSCYYHVGIM